MIGKAWLLRSCALVLGLVTACATPDSGAGVAAHPSVFAADPVLELDPAGVTADWAREVIALPPEFAPGLPSGTETLAFAPGMFATPSAEFWSYAFLLELDTAAPDAEQLDDILEQYYDGLLAAVAADKQRELGSDPATAEVRRTGPRDFTATLQLIDAFVTFDVLELNVRVRITRASADHCHLLFRVSPQPQTHPVWTALAQVGAQLHAESEAAHR